MQGWGVTLSQMHVPTSATKAYIEMLLDIALHQVSCLWPLTYVLQHGNCCAF